MGTLLFRWQTLAWLSAPSLAVELARSWMISAPQESWGRPPRSALPTLIPVEVSRHDGCKGWIPKGCSLKYMTVSVLLLLKMCSRHVADSRLKFGWLLQGGRVIYAQTDSLFCVLPKATNLEAIAAAQLAATLVSDAFPEHMEIKFEKVCQPFMLLHVNRCLPMCSFLPDTLPTPQRSTDSLPSSDLCFGM